jgi:hypothetical protein
MTREKHLLGHLIFQTNEGDVAVASKQNKVSALLSGNCNSTPIWA